MITIPMTDKSKADKASEINLSMAHARMKAAILKDGVAATIVRQIFNRWPDARPYLDRLNKIITSNLNDCDSAAQRIKAELDANRTRNNGKRKR